MEEVVSDIPMITNDAVVFGILMALLLLIFRTSEMPAFKKFYTIIPTLLLCYFLPSVFSTVGIISPHWIDVNAAKDFLIGQGYDLSGVDSFKAFKNYVINNEIDSHLIAPYMGKSQLYFVASRYLYQQV